MTTRWMVGLLYGVGVLGCGKGAQESAAPAASTGAEAAAPATFDDQVALGGQLYAAKCAGCHGGGGEGGRGAPPLVGISAGALPLSPRPGSVRTAQFVTVADVASFVVATMPPKAPGSLSADEYWAILAFDLSANGIALDQKLNPELAATLTIPR
jgi:S-disulfanyl-L-cysteine oxidoreductase SoxD